MPVIPSRRVQVVQRDESVLIPKNLLLTGSTQFEDFETTVGWSAVSTSVVANNAVEYKTGAQSIKLTTPSGSTGGMYRTVNWNMAAMQRISIQVYAHSTLADYSDGIFFYFYTDAGGTTGFSTKLSVSNIRAGWNLFNAARADFTTINGGSWANPIIRLRITMPVQPAKSVSASFDDLRFNHIGVPAVLLRFDDGYTSYYESVYPVLKARGIRATLPAQTNAMGVGGYLTITQLQELDAAGWTIANHTNSNTNLTTLSEADQETQIAGGKSDLVSWGLARGADYVVCPGGNWNADTLTALTNLSARTCQNGFLHTTRLPCQPMYSIYDVESTGINDTVSVATVQGYIDAAITRGSILPLHFHDIGSAGEWTAAQIEQLADYIALKRGQIYPITIDDYYQLTLGPQRVPVRR